jgi:hypothetical protein
MSNANRVLFSLAAVLVVMPAGAQVVTDSLRVFSVHSPPELARTDTILGASFDWNLPPPPGGVHGRLVRVRDIDGSDHGCSPLTNPDELDGQIALIRRGECTFEYKAVQAENAGASAWLVYQDDRVPDHDCSDVYMAAGDSLGFVFIPGAFLPRCVAVAIVPAVAGGVEVAASLDRVIDVSNEEDAPHAEGTIVVEPNPARGAFVVRVRTDAAEAVQLFLVDALGRRLAVLLDGRAGPSEHVFHVSTRLPAGVYRAVATGPGLAVGRTFTVVR